jgi:hypothetical protein
MDEKTNFIVYCIEEYKNAMILFGQSRDCFILNQYRVIYYIRSYYEALHHDGAAVYCRMTSICISMPVSQF